MPEYGKTATDYAPGLPDPSRFGEIHKIITGQELPFVIQKHLAERAGPHYDVRMGMRPDASAPLISFATKKEWPKPGEKRMLYRQPIHRGQYANFEGEITRGYGKGTVKTHEKGKLIVTQADKDKIKFVLAHKKLPETYTLIRRSLPSSKGTARQRATQGGSWLLINTTPMDAAKILGGEPEQVGLNKLRYTKIPSEQVDKVFNGKYLVQEKVDGASALYHLLADRIDVLSYRTAKNGRPIVHTYRTLGPGGAKSGIKIPEKLQSTILRGEIYGERNGKAIPSQELGGILNASTMRSLEKQREQRVKMKHMLFDVVRLGKDYVPPVSVGAEERMKILGDVSKYMPPSFTLPETVSEPEAQKDLYERIVSGKHPRTSEGIIAWPKEPGKKPIKVKATPESDVWVQDIFSGEKRLKDVGAGGFEYSLSPEGPVAGRVGTGFTEATRKEMLEDPEAWKGRLARIRSQGSFPSGAHRAPAFISLHEDYPLRKASSDDLNELNRLLDIAENAFMAG